MDLRNLGRSGLRVSAIGLGCNNFGGRIDLEATRRVIRKALDAGITLFGTADAYGERGGSETCMGQVLGDARKRIVLATKFGTPMDDTGGERRRLAPRHLRRRRGGPAAPANRLDRPVAVAPPRSAHADRGNAAHA